MAKWGSRRGRYNPCLYDDEGRSLGTFLHGDDFATMGTIENVTWLKAALENMFEIKTDAVGLTATGFGIRMMDGDASVQDYQRRRGN